MSLFQARRRPPAGEALDPLDNEASAGYHSAANVAPQQDPEGHVTTSGFDANGNQSAVTDDASATCCGSIPEKTLSATGHCPQFLKPFSSKEKQIWVIREKRTKVKGNKGKRLG